jgi:hypothetical protein
MSSDHRLDELGCEVKRLEEAFCAQCAAARRTARANLAVAGSLGLVIVAFVIANFVNLRSEWTREKFSASFEQELAEIRPKAEQELRKLGEDVLPVFVEAGKAQIAALGPQMAQRFEGEIDRLCKDLTAGVHGRLESSQRRVLEGVERAIAENFPDLRDEVKTEVLHHRLRDVTERSVASTIGEFDRKFGADVEKFQKALFAFDVSDTGEAPVDLQKKFLRLWLQILDQEIMEL